VKKTLGGYIAVLGLVGALGISTAPLSSSGALSLPPSTAYINLPILSPGGTPVGGNIIASLASSFVSSPAPSRFSGTLTTIVFDNDPNNALGGLTFLYILANSVTSIDDIHRLTLVDWAASTQTRVDNAANVNIGFVPANYVDRSANGDNIGFLWQNQAGRLMPGTFGSVLIQTSLQDYRLSDAFVIDGGVAHARTFAPVPETSTLVAGALLLLPFGLSTVQTFRRSRR